MTKYVNQVDVRGDGRVVLYQRDGLKNLKWQCRIRVSNATGYKVVSTKTANLRDAERFALNLYEELYMHVKAGGSVQSKTFKQVFEEWKKHVTTMGHTRRGGSWDATVDRVERYAVEFFGAMKIDAIKASDFTDYWAWRKSHYSKRVPANGTLKRERTSILPVFKYAVAKGYLTEIVSSTAPKAVLERRPTFTLEEYRKLYTSARKWVAAGQGKATARQRFVAQMYFLVLSNTGMRVGELRGLRWGDLRTVQTVDGTRLVAAVRGKTGMREVVFQSGAQKYVERLRAKEIASLRWCMIVGADGEIGDSINLTDEASKGRGGRVIALNRTLKAALVTLYEQERQSVRFDVGTSYVVRTERSERTSAQAIVNLFQRWYGDLGLVGCSSHSGRRTFITNAARKISTVGGSLRDVQSLAGHSSLATTQRYIDGDSEARRRVVELV